MTEAGQRYNVWIDSFEMNFLPERITPLRGKQEWRFRNLAGGSKLFIPHNRTSYANGSYPNVATRREWTMPWEFATGDIERAVLEMAAEDGLVHTLAFWKPVCLTYSAKAGQDVFYLPARRYNAPQALGRSTSDFPFRILIDGNVSARTVAYQSSAVTTASNVTSGQVWVSAASDVVKIAPALAVAAVVEIIYYPLHHVSIDIDDQIEKPFTEMKSVRFIEY